MKQLNILLLVLISSGCLNAGEKAEIQKKIAFNIYCDSSHGIFMFLDNTSYKSIDINSRFIVATRYLPGVEVYMDIIDNSGKKFLYQQTPRILFPEDQDEISLSPSILVGKRLDFDRLIQNYNLVPGKYSISAFYRHINWHKNLRSAEMSGMKIEDISDVESEEEVERFFDVLYPKNDLVLRSNKIYISIDKNNNVSCSEK